MTPITQDQYWSLLDKGKAHALYAHDFDASGPRALHTKLLPFGWNLEDLDHPNILPKFFNGPVPGITTTYGYLGCPGSTFAWHVEDACLGSMNVNLGGGGKVW